MTDTKEKIVRVCETIRRTENKTVRGDGYSATYALYEVKVNSKGVYYAVGIETENDDAFAVIGKDGRAARELYRNLSELGAMPCTLDDIVSDYYRENQY
ncbi:MAG: hypothetical protein J6A83_06115 [Clostridia bacterium]|nr:hypothetical protein [Clostridia bacterium]